MSFADTIKKSVLDGFAASDLSTASIIAALGVSMALGLFIYFVYRVTSKGGFYNRGFNKSLAVLSAITTGIVLAMQSNLVISLGMVGALSIVRFRNAVKEPGDLTFLFWSISAGIVVGAGLYELAIILSLCVTLLIVGLDLLPTLRSPYLLVVSAEEGKASEEALMTVLKGFAPRAKVRSRNLSRHGMEWIVEMRLKRRDESALMQKVGAVEGVHSLNLLTHDGEVRF